LVAVLRATQSGIFTRKTGWQFYVSHRLAVLRVTKGGIFTYNKRWEFYV